MAPGASSTEGSESDPFAPEPPPPNEPPEQPSENPDVVTLRSKLEAAGVTETQLMAWATEKKVARGEKKLEDFVSNDRTAQLSRMVQSFETILPGIKAALG
jgi:hypothetical protein